MHQSLFSLLAVAAPAFAVPQGLHERPGGNYGCGKHSSRTVAHGASTAQSSVVASSYPSSSKAVAVPTTATSESVIPTPSTSAVTEAATSATSEIIVVPTSTKSETVVAPSTTSKAVASPSTTSAAAASPSTSSEVVVVPTSATSKAVATSTSSIAAATTSSAAVEDESSETLTANFCGAPNSYEVLSGTPWIVYSMNYNYQSISGSCCTGYYSTSGSGDTQSVHWSSVWDIDEAVSTNVVKGYSFIGLTQNLETTIDSISSIPSTYTWTVSNTTAYKGNVVYDFMTSDTKGDSTSSSAQELMLWLQYEGGQVPIGWADGAVATIDGLFGKDGWQLYQGKNTDTGITVSSLLVPEDAMFDGTFEGDIKDWLLALSEQGVFSTSTYLNVGNAGMEPYWGTVTFDNDLSLRINL